MPKGDPVGCGKGILFTCPYAEKFSFFISKWRVFVDSEVLNSKFFLYMTFKIFRSTLRAYGDKRTDRQTDRLVWVVELRLRHVV